MASANSKNILVGALLVWACGATLLAFTACNRVSLINSQCVKEMPSDVVKRLLSSSFSSEHVDSNVVTSGTMTTEGLPEGDRVDSNSTLISSTGSFLAEIPNHLQKYALEIFHPKSHSDSEEFTMILLTYKRVKMLSTLIKHYCRTKKLHKILVIWNDVDSTIPQQVLNLTDSCQTRLEFIQEKENKLTNRFKPRPQIETECVCIIDDDRLIDDINDLEGAFSAWQSFRERIIGYEVRSYTLQSDGSFFYGQYDKKKPYPGYSIMGTGTAILHKSYLKMFFDPEVLPQAMFDYVDKGKNCEDLAMNVMASKFLEDVSWHQPAALSYKAKGQIKNMEAVAYEPGGHRGLSMRPDHYRRRTECLNKFAEFYAGRLPLHYSFIRVIYDKNMS